MLVVALVPSLAVATTPPPAQGSATQARAADKDLVCTREKSLGSKMSRKVCTTPDQRQLARDKAQRDVHDAGRCADQENACIGHL